LASHNVTKGIFQSAILVATTLCCYLHRHSELNYIKHKQACDTKLYRGIQNSLQAIICVRSCEMF